MLALLRRTAAHRATLGGGAHAAPRRLPASSLLGPGQVLCHEGEEGHAMFVVLSGHLVVSKAGKQVAVGQARGLLRRDGAHRVAASARPR